jgi:FtsH-binding integral membrane protein
MQNTRLSNLLGYISINLRNWLANPWRRTSVMIICLLAGYFLGSAVPLISGQAAVSDIAIAAVMLTLTELVSFLAYRPRDDSNRLGGWGTNLLNALKIGFIYSMFVESFKLGS